MLATNLKHSQCYLFQIRLSFTGSDEGKAETVMDISSDIITKAVKELKKVFKHDRLDKMTDNMVDDLTQKPEDSDDEKLDDLVQKQRKLERETEKQKKDPTEPKKYKEQLKSAKSKIDEFKVLLDELEKALDKPRTDDQKVKNRLKILYILSSQLKSKQNIKKISEKLHPVLTQDEKKDLDSKVTDLEEKVKQARETERQHSALKQFSELRKARLEPDSDDRTILSEIIKIEKQIIELSTKKNDKPSDYKEKLSLIDRITDDIHELKKKIDSRLLKDPSVSDILKHRLLEVILRHRIASEDLDSDIKELEQEDFKRAITDPKSRNKEEPEKKKRELAEKKDNLKKETGDLAERLVFAEDKKIEKEIQKSDLTPVDEKKQTDLRKVQIKHLKLTDKLIKEDRIRDGQKVEITKEEMEDAAKDIDDCNKLLKEIVDEGKAQPHQDKKYSPVIIRTLKTATKHAELSRRFGEMARERVRKVVVKDDDKDLEAYKKVVKDVEKSMDEAEAVKYQAKDLIKKEKIKPESDQRDRKPNKYLGHEEILEKSTTETLKKVHEVKSTFICL